MILAGIVILGRWITDSVGGYINPGTLLAGLVLLAGAYGVSVLE